MWVTFNTTWNSTAGLGGYIFSINQSGTWVNSTFASFVSTRNISVNSTFINASAGTNVTWLFYANNSLGEWNVSALQSFVVSSAGSGTLNVSFISLANAVSQPFNQTFSLTANVTCLGTGEVSCGIVNGTVRYNATSAFPNAALSGNGIFGAPFYTLELNPRSCGAMTSSSVPCNLTWTINATGGVGTTYTLDVNFSSTDVAVNSVNSTPFNVSIISNPLSIALSSELSNVQFNSTLIPGSQNNDALNNSNNGYNISCSYLAGSCNVSIKSNDNLVSGANSIGVGNISWNHANSVSGEKLFTLAYQTINNTLANNAVQRLYFWLDVPPAQPAGNYISNFTIHAEPS